jgi:hypothetical protein
MTRTQPILGLALGGLLASACGDDGAASVSATETDAGTAGSTDAGETSAPGSSSSEDSSGEILACPDAVLDELVPMDARGSTVDASDDFVGSCSTGAPAPDLAFVWTAPTDGVYTFDTFATAFDTVLFVLDGDCGGEELACNDDFDVEAQVRQSALSLELRAGQTVTVVVDGFSTEHVGDVVLHVNGGAGSCPDGTLDILESGLVESTSTAINASSAACGGAFAPERSYAFTADAAGTYTFDTFGSSFDTVLYVLDEGCEGTMLACNDDVEATRASGALVELDEGQTVTVVVDGAPGQRGAFDLAVGRLEPGCPHDDLGTQLPVIIAGSTVGATNTTGSSCGGWFSPDLTYAWQAPVAGLYRFETAGSGFDTVLSVRSGACDGVELACNDDRGPTDETSELALLLQAGQTVTVAVGGSGRDTGSTLLAISELSCPAVDLGSPVPHVQMGTFAGASDTLSGSCGAQGALDRTLGWTAPADGTYVFDTFGSSFDTVLYAFDGGCTGDELACNDDAGASVFSRLTLELVEGQTIVLVIEGYEGQTGNWTLNITTM